MGSRDLQRQVSIEGYAGMRRYVLDNQHLHKRAEMLVQVQGDPDGTKHFEVVSEEGWKAAHKHVLRKDAGIGIGDVASRRSRQN